MVGEIIAAATLSATVAGSAWKLQQNINEQFEELRIEREIQKAEVRLINYRLARLEGAREEVSL